MVAAVPLILASGSPRRRELLARIGISIEVIVPAIDESVHTGELGGDCAQRLALAKASAVAERHPDRFVLAADTVVEIGGHILGKPTDGADAARMLALLSGATHRVITGFALRGPRRYESSARVTTEVDMRPLASSEIADYVAAGEWRDKAGGYAVQGMAAAMVNEVRGSITNVIGLPLAEVALELARAGAGHIDYQRGSSAVA